MLDCKLKLIIALAAGATLYHVLYVLFLFVLRRRGRGRRSYNPYM